MFQMAFHTTVILCRLKLRLLFNSLKSWASAGKLIGAFFGIILTASAITGGSTELISSLQQLPYAEILLDWLLAAIVIYGVFIVFTGDLITGHTLGTGQMSNDFTFLCTLPVPPLSLILVKLFERLVTDYLGIIILLSAFLGVTCREGFTLEGIVLSLLLFTQISLLIGLSINLVHIFLKRFFRNATINNFFSLMGYLSAFLTIVPYLIFSNFPADSLAWVLDNFEILNSTFFKIFVPAKWVGICLISKAFCDEFFFFSAFWAAAMFAGSMVFYLAIRLNWLHYSHSTARRAASRSKKIFSGFMQKEILLLTSDYNLTINAILMPVSIIVIEIYFLRQFLNFGAVTSILNTISGAVIYFCMFGPMNSIGSEGKAISALETMPISPSEFLKRKFLFWLAIAEAIFIPAVAITMHLLSFNTQAILVATLTNAIFTAACVGASISISAIFAIYDSKMLQQRSTFAGKLAALGIMLLATPIKNFSWLNLNNALIFACISLIMYMKARIYVFYRLDQQARASETHKRLDLLLIFFAFAAVETAVRQFFLAVIPMHETGLWSWAIAVMLMTPVVILTFLSRYKPLPAQKLPEKAMIRGLMLTAPAIAMCFLVSHLFPLATAALKSDMQFFLPSGSAVFSFFGFPESMNWLSTSLTGLLLFLTPVTLIGLSTKLIFHSFLNCKTEKLRPLYQTIGAASLVLLVPAQLISTALITGAGVFFLSHHQSDDRPATLFAVIISAVATAWLLFS